MKHLGFVAGAVLILWAGTAHAQTINYTEQTTASGSLGINSFTSALVSISFIGDVSNVTGGPNLFLNSIGTGTVTVAGIGEATFTDALEAFCFQPGSIAGISDSAIPDDILDTSNAAFSSYGLATAIGPLSGGSTLTPGHRSGLRPAISF